MILYYTNSSFAPLQIKKCKVFLAIAQALKSWSNFSLVLFGPRREIHRQIHVTTLRNPYFDIYVLTTCRNQRNNFDYSMLQLNKFNEFALLQHLALFGLAKALVPDSDSVKRQ